MSPQLALALVTLFAAAPALAKPAEAKPATEVKHAAAAVTRYETRTRYDFDDDLVEGAFSSPSDVLIGVRGAVAFPSLVQARTNFLPEIEKSAEDR